MLLAKSCNFYRIILVLLELIKSRKMTKSTIIACCALLALKVNSYSQEKSTIDEKFIIVLDVQECWTEKSIIYPSSEVFIGNINKVISKANPENIIYVTTAQMMLTVSLSGIKKEFAEGQWFSKQLLVRNNNIINKESGNAFTSKQLCKYLRKRKAKNIIVVGLLAEKCVSKTLQGGIKLGYNMFVVPEAIAGIKAESKTAAIDQFKSGGVKIIPIDEFDN